MPPAVLHYECWNGLAVLAVSPLPVPRRARVSAELLTSAIKEIAATGSTGGTGGTEGTAGHAWHGDLSPWNLAPTSDGRLFVWDWERYETGVPLGFDALHHLFQRLLRRMPPPLAAQACLAQALPTLAPLGLSAAQARGTALRYLIALADRHAGDGHEPLGPAQHWLNPLLDAQELLA